MLRADIKGSGRTRNAVAASARGGSFVWCRLSGCAVRGPKPGPSCSRGLLPLRGRIFSSSSLELLLCSGN
ncbi:hypothetical protein AV530_013713 [Patagioenas fasciata monilis]|uniref:Uncharacterized protein n=1 Tax=Patagioenas fasciata monilis TaxID=372326 RepID=A0A1V4J7N0_PATFA|nr:hypothetical protein AV530_013713 [Patagioenas fasciata monilis]